MAASNTKIKKCSDCGSDKLRFYSAAFGDEPVRDYVQCLTCAWSKELKRREPPKHYDQNIQPWDAIDAWSLDFWAGNAVKYICRAGKKEDKAGKEIINKLNSELTDSIKNLIDGDYLLLKEDLENPEEE